jgi:hypothetical protein
MTDAGILTTQSEWSRLAAFMIEAFAYASTYEGSARSETAKNPGLLFNMSVRPIKGYINGAADRASAAFYADDRILDRDGSSTESVLDQSR